MFTDNRFLQYAGELIIICWKESARKYQEVHTCVHIMNMMKGWMDGWMDSYMGMHPILLYVKRKTYVLF